MKLLLHSFGALILVLKNKGAVTKNNEKRKEEKIMAITRKKFNARLAKKWGIPKRKAKVFSQLFFDTLMECL